MARLPARVTPGHFFVAALSLALTAPAATHGASPPPTATHWKPVSLLSRAASPGAFDDAHHRVVLFPQDLGVAGAADLWTLDTRSTAGWVTMPTAGTPAPWRAGRITVYDPLHERVLVWGGYDFHTAPGSGADLWTLDLAGTPTWSHLTCAGSLPGERYRASAVFDPVRHRLLLFGGAGAPSPSGLGNDVWALDLDGTPTWSPIAVAGPRPDAREGAAAIYDPVRDRLVIQGGEDSLAQWSGYGSRSDAWALTLSGTPAWTRLFQGAGAGESYGSHAAVYDPNGDRMLLIGGVDSTWYPVTHHRELRAIPLASGGMTAVLDTTGAPNEMGIVAAFRDPVLDAVIVHGDIPTASRAAGTWRLSLAGTPAWTPFLPEEVEPVARFGQAQAYDARRGRTIFYGGRRTDYVFYEYPTTYFDDLWSLSLDSRPLWRELDGPGEQPPTRQYATLVADPDADRMWLFGGDQWVGITGPSPERPADIEIGSKGYPVFLGDVWRLDLAPTPDWTAIVPAGTPPSRRDGHVAVLDSRRHRMLVFGGRDSLGPCNDVWALSLDASPTWTRLFPTGNAPLPRVFAVGGYDAVADRVLILGGLDATSSPFTDLWSLSLAGTPAWTRILPDGTAPLTAGDRPGYFDATHRRMVVVGGGSSTWGQPATVISVLSFDGPIPTWSVVPADGRVPGDVQGRSASWDESVGRLVVLWGSTGTRNEYTEDAASQITFDEVPAGVGATPAPPPSPVLALAAPVPDPVRDVVRARAVCPTAGSATLELLDAGGRRVRVARLSRTAPGPFECALPVAGVPSGMYWLRLTQGTRSAAVKVVVMR